MSISSWESSTGFLYFFLESVFWEGDLPEVNFQKDLDLSLNSNFLSTFNCSSFLPVI